MTDGTDVYDDQTGGVERIVERSRINSGSGLGIFPRADQRDVSEEQVEERVESYGKILREFAQQMEFGEEGQGIVYYHNRLKNGPQLLEMASTMMGEDPYSIAPYLVIDITRPLQAKPPILIARLDDHLGTSFGKQYDISVWAYNPSMKEFSEPRVIQSRVPTKEIYRNLVQIIRNENPKFDPFIEVASAAYTL